MSRKRLAWLAVAVTLAIVVAYQTVASAAARGVIRRAGRCAHRRTGCRRAGRDGADPAARPRIRLPPGGVRRLVDRRQPAPGGHNGCDTRNDILDRDLVDKTYVSIKRCPNAVGHRHTARPVHQRHRRVRPRQPDRCVGADRPHRPVGVGVGPRCPRLDRRRCGCGSPTIRPTCSRSQGRPTRTRAIPSRPLWMPPNAAFRCQYADAVHRGAARLRAARRCAVGGGAA